MLFACSRILKYGESSALAFLQWARISSTFDANSFTAFTPTTLGITFKNACMISVGVITSYGATLRDCAIALNHSLASANGVAVNGYTGRQTLTADAIFIGY
jgi:hypothetical protein